MIRHIIHLTTALTLIGILSQSAPAVSYYTEGHADLGLGDEDELELHFHAHSGATINGLPLIEDQEYEPGDVVIVVPKSTKNYVHGIGGATAAIAAHLGLVAGEDYWFLPETNDGAGGAAALHAPNYGLGAEDITAGVFDDDLFNLTLLAMSGPMDGQFGLENYENGWLMSTADGISGSDKVEGIPVGAHEHLNWYFTKPGLYEFTFRASAAIGGETVLNDNTFTFQVVPEPGIFALLASALCSGMIAFKYRRLKA
jgi:surface-anchored protein